MRAALRMSGTSLDNIPSAVQDMQLDRIKALLTENLNVMLGGFARLEPCSQITGQPEAIGAKVSDWSIPANVPGDNVKLGHVVLRFDARIVPRLSVVVNITVSGYSSSS
jgi:hypothetical protein